MLPDPVLEALDRTARDMLERTAQPGLALGVTDRDATLAIRTYGLADLAARRPVEPDTLFEIGSIGKTFTAVLVLQLAGEGAVDLDAPVERYLPWFAVPRPEGAPAITIAHLLSHTAGIVAGLDGTPEAAFQVWALRDQPAASGAGARFHYSNVGYKALGLVLAAVTGEPYPELVRTRILAPLGMRATEPEIRHAMRARLAVGYEYLHDDRLGYPGAPLAPATWLETDTADGSVASTAGDMCAFLRLLLAAGRGPAGRVLGEEAFARMVAPHARVDDDVTAGYGLMTRGMGDREITGHGGGMVGYLAAIQFDAEAGIGAVVLQNGMGASPMALARAAIAIVRAGGPPPAARTGAAGDESAALAGRYDPAGAAFEPIELVASEDGLVLRTGGRDIGLEALGHDLFLVPDPAFDRFPLSADRAPDGTIELWHGDRRYVRACAPPRMPAQPSAALRAIAGRYRSHNPWTTNFSIVLRGDRPWLIFPAAPDGFDDEQALVPAPDGSFRVGHDPGNPERVRFDTTVGGRALRAWLSDWPYYRVG